MDVYIISAAGQPTFHHRSRYFDQQCRRTTLIETHTANRNSQDYTVFADSCVCPWYISRNGEVLGTLARHRENFATNKDTRDLYPRKNDSNGEYISPRVVTLELLTSNDGFIRFLSSSR